MAVEHKYVRHSTLGFVLWPRTDDIWHEHVGNLLRRVPGSVVSAGFAVVDGVAFCYGRSESLGLCAHVSDSAALAAQLGLPAA